MSKLKILAVAFILSLLTFGGYISYGEYRALEDLDVKLSDAAVTMTSLTSAYITLELEFNNPTKSGTPSFRVEFDVYLDNSYLGHGSLPSIAVRAGSTSTQVIIIATGYTTLIDAALSAGVAFRRGEPALAICGTLYGKIFFEIIPVSKVFKT